MQLKRFKYKVEFIVDVNDIDDDVSDIAEDLLDNDQCVNLIESSNFMTYQNRQKRFLHAMVADKEKLKEYVNGVFPELVRIDGRELIEEFLLYQGDSDGTDNVIYSVIETLPKEDQDFFTRAERKGGLTEYLELVYQAFALDILNISVEEIK
jgi:hypothetical protein